MEILTYARSKARIDRIIGRADEVDPGVLETVRRIIGEVRERGDEALREFSLEFDGYDSDRYGFRVTPEIIEECYGKADREFLDVIAEAVRNVRNFHERQVESTWTAEFEHGVRLGQKITPLDRVAVYVPGGKAFYPSTAIMNIVPALVAGVRDIMVLTPPSRFLENPVTGATLKVLGVTNVFLVGGAQAVAAAAFGTGIIPRADKIVGPGNIYVATAKREVYGHVDIDMIAGPSEIVVLASGSAHPGWIACDLLSQAEHGTGNESAVLVTDSQALAEKVSIEVDALLAGSPRGEMIRRVLDNFGAIIVTGNIMEGVELVNRIAPEHLEIVVDNEEEVLGAVRNAGAIFIGPYSSEPVGDYWAGPNHVLPTGGTARFFSPLGVYDFYKRSSIVRYTKEAIRMNAKKIDLFARREGLDFHARAVMERLNDPG